MKSTINILFSFILFITLLSNITCLYRSLFINKPKCYFDTFYSEQNIIMKYKVLNMDIDESLLQTNYNRFIIKLYDSNNVQLNMYTSSKLKGKFSYSIEKSDMYKICIESGDKELFTGRGIIKIQFKIETSEDVMDTLKNSADLKDFELVDDKMKRLAKKTDNILNMQKYQFKMENRFSKSQLSSHRRIVLLTIIQIIILIIVGSYHVINLRKVFKNKINAY